MAPPVLTVCRPPCVWRAATEPLLVKMSISPCTRSKSTRPVGTITRNLPSDCSTETLPFWTRASNVPRKLRTVRPPLASCRSIVSPSGTSRRQIGGGPGTTKRSVTRIPSGLFSSTIGPSIWIWLNDPLRISSWAALKRTWTVRDMLPAGRVAC